MEVPVEDSVGIDQGPVEVPLPPPPSSVDVEGGDPELPLEGDAEDSKKKKKSVKKSKRSTPKSGRKKLTDEGELSSPKASRKKSSDDGDAQKSSNRRARRRSSMGDVTGVSNQIDKGNTAVQSLHNRPSRRRSIGSESGDDLNQIDKSNKSFESLSNRQARRRSMGSTGPEGSNQNDRSNKSAESLSRGRPPSNRSFDDQKNHVRSSSNHSFDSTITPLSTSRHSVGSDLKTPKLGAFIGNTEGNDFASDMEEETMCSIDNINLVVKNYLETPSSDKPFTLSGQKSQEEQKTNADAKPKKKRQPQLKKTDELGRGSSHYKLEGVYSNQSNNKKYIKKELEDGVEKEVLPNSPIGANERDTSNKTPIQGRLRMRRRGSLGDDGLTSPRSRSRELTSPRSRRRGRSRELASPRSIQRSRSAENSGPKTAQRSRSAEHSGPRSAQRSGSKDLISPRSSSRELISPRGRKPRAPKDSTRIPPPDPLSVHKKSSEKRVKRTHGANIISPESKEAVNKLFGTDVASGDDKNVPKNMVSENQPLVIEEPEEKSLAETATENRHLYNDAEEKNKPIKSNQKSLEKKQRRRSSMGTTIKKEKTALTPNDVEKELVELCSPLSEEDKNSDQVTNDETENTTSENPTEESIEDNELGSKPVKAPSKSLEKKQRRRSSMGTTMKKEKTALKSSDAEKELVELSSPLPEDNLNVENAKSENYPSPSAHLNGTEKSDENDEKPSKGMNSEEVEKKQRRRNSIEKITGRSSHKLPKKSSRGKKVQAKSEVELEVSPKTESRVEQTSPSAAKGGGSANEEIAEIPDQNSNDSAKKENGVEKLPKKDRTLSRRGSVKERKKREKDPSGETVPQAHLKSRDESELQPSTNDIGPATDSSAKELIQEQENQAMKRSMSESLHKYLSSHHSRKELESVCSSTGSFASESMASDEESAGKDDDNAHNPNYLQLTFVAENGTDGNKLFALMDEKIKKSSAHGLDGTEHEDRNGTLRSFVSFGDEIELKVSTTSCTILQADRVKSSDVVSTDDSFSADEDFPSAKKERVNVNWNYPTHDANPNANATWDNPSQNATWGAPKPKGNLFSTPMQRPKKKLSPFGMSRSLHDLGLAHNQNNSVPDPNNRRRGMLQMMKEGSRRTLQKAASTRNMLEQATTKVMSRRKEESKGLLLYDSD